MPQRLQTRGGQLRVSADVYITDSGLTALRAVESSGAPGLYVPLLPYRHYFAEVPRDLEVYLDNLDSRAGLRRLIVDALPEAMTARLSHVFGTARVLDAADPSVWEEQDEDIGRMSDTVSRPEGAIAFEAGDQYGEALAKNYANARGLQIVEMPRPSSAEANSVASLLSNMRANSEQNPTEMLLSIPARSVPRGIRRMTIISDGGFPYQLLYPGLPVAVLPQLVAWRVLLEEVALASLDRKHVSAVAIDATAPPGEPTLVSEIPDLIPPLAGARMLVVVFGQGTDGNLFNTILNQYPFDVMLVAAHSAPIETQNRRYSFTGATGSHLVDTEEQVASSQKKVRFLRLDGKALELADPAVVDDMRAAFGAGMLQLLSSRKLPSAGDEALRLPNGETHLGHCRLTPGPGLPLVLANFCGSHAFGENLLRGGVGAFIGTLWPISDHSARAVAREFVRASQDMTFTEALHQARREAHDPGAANAYVYLGSAEHGFNLPEAEDGRASALHALVNRLHEVVAAYARYSPMNRLPPQFAAGFQLVLPRLQRAMDLLVQVDPTELPYTLWLRARLVEEAVENGTPTSFFEEELRSLESELRVRGDDEEGQRLVMQALVSVGVARFMGGTTSDGLKLIAEGLEGLEDAKADEASLAAAHATHGNCLFLVGRFQEADQAFAQAQLLLSRVGRTTDAGLLARRAACAVETGEWTSLDEDLDDAESEARASGDQDAVHAVLQTKAFIAKRRGDESTALALDEQIVRLLEEESANRPLVPARYNLAAGLARAGRREEAERQAVSAVELARQVGDERELMMALNNMAAIKLGFEDRPGASAAMQELKSLNWAEHPEIAARIAHWEAVEALVEGREEDAMATLKDMLAGGGLPADMEYAAAFRLGLLYARRKQFPPNEELSRLEETLLRTAVESGKERDILPLLEQYLEMQVSQADVHGDLTVTLASARLRHEAGTERGLADARFVTAVATLNSGEVLGGMQLLRSAGETYRTVGDYLLMFLCAARSARARLWYSHNGGTPDDWVAGLEGCLEAWAIWREHLEGEQELWDNNWRPFLAETLVELCQGLILTFEVDVAMAAKATAKAVAAGTTLAVTASQLPSDDQICAAREWIQEQSAKNDA